MKYHVKITQITVVEVDTAEYCLVGPDRIPIDICEVALEYLESGKHHQFASCISDETTVGVPEEVQ